MCRSDVEVVRDVEGLNAYDQLMHVLLEDCKWAHLQSSVCSLLRVHARADPHTIETLGHRRLVVSCRVLRMPTLVGSGRV